jgi:hypothetical protein
MDAGCRFSLRTDICEGLTITVEAPGGIPVATDEECRREREALLSRALRLPLLDAVPAAEDSYYRSDSLLALGLTVTRHR